eukprot:TRINITY_DN12454_c0_g1_i1.p1 TRINITY_DN12454_c0_g1~~TRINITY_DN12454_c0_g1_i1.p1  ORF type:complete len:618 (-),score=120.43 TRINITY_DN12454_c0_g1_i1:127-1980(-)
MEAVLTLFSKHLLVNGSVDDASINWDSFCQVLMCIDPATYTEDVLKSLYSQAALNGIHAGSSRVSLKPLLAWIFKPREEINDSNSAAEAKKPVELKRQKTGELSGLNSEKVRVRTVTGNSVLCLTEDQAKGLTVGVLRASVGTALGRCIDEVKLLVDARLLEHNDDLLESLFVDKEVLEVTAVTVAIPDFDPELPALEQLETLKAMIMMSSQEYQSIACLQFRKILSVERNPPIQEVIDLGIVPRLVELSQAQDAVNIQIEALWALTNVASGTSAQTQSIVDAGAVPVMVELASSQTEGVREQAVWALGNIAGDSTATRDLALEAGALLAVTAALEPELVLTTKRHAAWTLSNLCRGRPQPDLEALAPALRVLPRILECEDTEVLTDACWATSYLSDGTNDRIGAVIQTGICERLVELLRSRNPAIQTPSLKTLGNICTGDDEQTQVALDHGLLGTMRPLLSHVKQGIRKEACWTLSNILGGTQNQVQLVFEEDLMPDLIRIVREDVHQVAKEAAWCLANATCSKNVTHIRHLAQNGAMEAMAEMLGGHDPKTQRLVLDFFTNVLTALREKNQSDFVALEGAVPWHVVEELTISDENPELAESSRHLLETCRAARTH